jgi:hypothetical protein
MLLNQPGWGTMHICCLGQEILYVWHPLIIATA